MSDPTFTWEGRELKTMKQVMEAVLEIVASGDAERAAEFIGAYSMISPNARTNIGYGAGYYDHATAKKIFVLFDCRHPIFGTEWPSPKRAFELGQQHARNESNRRGKKDS